MGEPVVATTATGVAPIMSPAFAANTWSGSAGAGSTTSTRWPSSVSVRRSASYCRHASRWSVGVWGRIQGVIAKAFAPSVGRSELWCRPGTSSEQIGQLLRGVGQVRGASTVTGGADALVWLRTEDAAQLDHVVETIRASPIADRTRTTVVLAALVP